MNLSQDWERIIQIADQRRRNNVTPWHVNNQYLEVIGAAGELAARRFLGLPEDLHLHFDGGKDLRWAGKSVDVKATKLTPNIEFRHLQWPETKIIKADIILLMGVDLNRKIATPIGWAFAEEILGADINYDRDRPCHEIPVRDMHPAWELYSLLAPSQSGSGTRLSVATL